MKYKYLFCPECGQKLCRVAEGSHVVITCPKCKIEYNGYADKDGGVHALPFEENIPTQKAKQA